MKRAVNLMGILCRVDGIHGCQQCREPGHPFGLGPGHQGEGDPPGINPTEQTNGVKRLEPRSQVRWFQEVVLDLDGLPEPEPVLEPLWLVAEHDHGVEQECVVARRAAAVLGVGRDVACNDEVPREVLSH